MGRRAKNKQGDPESLQELTTAAHSSPKKLGKRKADTGIDRQQPTKKVKDSVQLVSKHTNSPSSKKTVKNKSKHEGRPREDVPWNGINSEEDSSSAAWEDIQDNQDEDSTPTQTKCVTSCASRRPHLL